MKLPGIEYGGVQSLGRHDVSAPIATARAEAAAVSHVVGSVGRVLEIYKERQDQIEWRKNSLEASTQLSEWERLHIQKSHYDAKELGEDIQVRRTETIVDQYGNKIEKIRDQIPAHEVYPQLLSRMHRAIGEVVGESFSNMDSASKWTTMWKESGQQAVMQATVRSVEKQRAFGVEATLGHVDRAVATGQYEMALEILQSNPDVKPEVVRERQHAIGKRKESDRYEKLLTSQHVPGMAAALKYLENTQEYDGRLEPHEARSYAYALRSALHAAGDRVRADQADYERRIKYRARKAISTLDAGGKINPADLALVSSQLGEIGDEELGMDLSISMMAAEVFAQKFRYMSTEQREAAIRQSEQNAFGQTHGSIESAALLQKIREQSDRMTAALHSDAFRFYKDAMDVEVPKLDMQNLAQSLAERVEHGHKLNKTYGVPFRVLDNAEADTLAEHLRTLPKVGKLHLAGEIHQGLEDDAFALYDQLDLKEVGAFTLAGRTVAEGDHNDALLILEGEQYMAENSSIIKEVRQDAEDRIQATLAPVYEADPARYARTREAALGVYAYLTRGQTRTRPDWNKLDEAIRVVTGGLVEYEDSWIEAPTRNADKKEVRRWFNEVSPEYIDTLGGVANGWTGDRALEGVRKGNVKPISTNTRGEYLLLDTFSGYLIKKPDQTPFILKYDLAAPRVRPHTYTPPEPGSIIMFGPPGMEGKQ